MILVNFEFMPDNIGLLVGNVYLDLHNNYDFAQVVEREGSISFVWRRAKGTWVPEQSPSSVHLTLEAVSFAEHKGTPSSEFMEYGFFNNDTVGPVEYNGTHVPVIGHELFVARFENKSEVAVMAGRASVTLGNDV